MLSAAADNAADPHGSEDSIVVTARRHAPSGDPLAGLNLKAFQATQAVDKAIVRPVAMTYQKVVPSPLRSGFRNALNNLREPVAVANFFLQLKPGKAFETMGRFALNTTIGVAGLFDMAKRKPFYLPRRPNGFANTLGYYGVKPGAFLFLPIVGPTSVRDLIGDGLDRFFLPVVMGKPFNRPVLGLVTGTLSSLDQRAEFDEKLEVLHSDSDPYAATREDYLRNRQDIIRALHTKRGYIASTPVSRFPPPLPDNPDRSARSPLEPKP